MPELNNLISGYEIFPGYNLSHFKIQSEHITYTIPDKETINLIYCISGRMCWKCEKANSYINHGDLLLHSACGHDKDLIDLPNGFFEGIQIQIQPDLFFSNTPDILANSDITQENIKSAFLSDNRSYIINSCDTLTNIFNALQSANGENKYQSALIKLKAIELVIFLAEHASSNEKCKKEGCDCYVETIHMVHDFLTENLDQRYTIDDLSKKFHINPTTLKNEFKEVYGTSIAAHIKEHRMELAAELITNSNFSIAEIAKKCGYESQGKLTAAFKGFYNTLPSEYRKNRT